jgi:hypothetical protein
VVVLDEIKMGRYHHRLVVIVPTTTTTKPKPAPASATTKIKIDNEEVVNTAARHFGPVVVVGDGFMDFQGNGHQE